MIFYQNLAYDFCGIKADRRWIWSGSSSNLQNDPNVCIRPPSVHTPNRLGTHVLESNPVKFANRRTYIEQSPTLIPFQLHALTAPHPGAGKRHPGGLPVLLLAHTYTQVLVLVASGCIFPCGTATVHRQPIISPQTCVCTDATCERMTHTSTFTYNIMRQSVPTYIGTCVGGCQGLAPSS